MMYDEFRQASNLQLVLTTDRCQIYRMVDGVNVLPYVCDDSLDIPDLDPELASHGGAASITW